MSFDAAWAADAAGSVGGALGRTQPVWLAAAVGLRVAAEVLQVAVAADDPPPCVRVARLRRGLSGVLSSSPTRRSIPPRSPPWPSSLPSSSPRRDLLSIALAAVLLGAPDLRTLVRAMRPTALEAEPSPAQEPVTASPLDRGDGARVVEDVSGDGPRRRCGRCDLVS